MYEGKPEPRKVRVSASFETMFARAVAVIESCMHMKDEPGLPGGMVLAGVMVMKHSNLDWSDIEAVCLKLISEYRKVREALEKVKREE